MPQSVSNTLIVRYSEITLKGRNRPQFEKQLSDNVKRHLKSHGRFRVRRGQARLLVEWEDDPALGPTVAVDILRGLPGIVNLSVAELAPREPEPLTEAVLAHVAGRLAEWPPRGERALSFRVKASRKDKRYPIGSMALASQLGAAILDRFEGLRVDLDHPDFTVWVEIWEERAAIYGEKIPGPGGLAVGSSGKTICLLSGGIDSPVAAYRMMTRGSPVVFLNFHSFPFIGEKSKEKIHDLVRFLARYQPRSRLYVAPFARAQEAIRDHCPAPARTVLYRRMMNRVANRIAEKEGALALVTGESLGQVASQTLENIRAIEETAAFPVLQPLIGMAKQEIVATGRKIGTYPISIRPYPDCCTLFQPKNPMTRAKPDRLAAWEAGLPIEELVAESVANAEVTDYPAQYFPADWD